MWFREFRTWRLSALEPLPTATRERRAGAYSMKHGPAISHANLYLPLSIAVLELLFSSNLLSPMSYKERWTRDDQKTS